METINNQSSQPVLQPSSSVDYAAALRQYNKYGRGRSMKKFCEDEGYDYWKFCKLAREGQIEMGSKTGTETLSYILMEKFWYNTPFEQIVRKLRALGLRMSKSTLGDNVHRAIEYMCGKMKEWWEKTMLRAGYWMIDETPGLVSISAGSSSTHWKRTTRRLCGSSTEWG